MVNFQIYAVFHICVLQACDIRFYIYTHRSKSIKCNKGIDSNQENHGGSIYDYDEINMLFLQQQDNLKNVNHDYEEIVTYSELQTHQILRSNNVPQQQRAYANIQPPK